MLDKDATTKETRQSLVAKRSSFVESTLTLIFWLCASLLIMQPARLYFTSEIAYFFNFEGAVDYEVFFTPFIFTYTLSLLISVFLTRVVCHAHVLALALGLFFLLGIALLFSLSSFISAVLFGGALGLIPAPAVCSVIEKLGVFPRTLQKGINSVQKSRVHPVGMYILIPVLVTLIITLKSVLGLLLILCFLCLLMLILLLRFKNFGFFKSAPTLTQSLAGTFVNGMFYLVIFMLIFISLIDMFVLYCVPQVVRVYAPQDIKNTTALILLIMLIVRIAMIVFAELALIRMMSRRMLVLSACAIALAVLLLSMARDQKGQLIVLFVLSSSLSVGFPALIKSIAKFTPFSVLPASIVGMVLVGNMVTFFGTVYFFSYALRTKNIEFFLLLFSFAFLMLTLLFFIMSRRKQMVLEHGS